MLEFTGIRGSDPNTRAGRHLRVLQLWRQVLELSHKATPGKDRGTNFISNLSKKLLS